ncbi:transcriptional regulator [Bryobacterales bacterium F-183]|nr:transcriptional regulator [Bryobacterales bacterium F-183]
MPDGFPSLLRSWRTRRRLSQLELALTSGVSQRHISFLESGRAKPSRDMTLKISETLQVPLRERNAWLVAAGFAPLFRSTPLDDPQMSQVMSAVRMMLANHEPFPAVAIDRAWNVRMANAPFERMAAILGIDTTANPPNLVRLFFHPQGIRQRVTNWNAIAPLLWCRAVRESETAGGDEMRQILAELAPLQDTTLTASVAADTPLLPVLPVTIAHNGLQISLFSVISAFGTAQDVTADELHIESFFPADEATDRLFRGL